MKTIIIAALLLSCKAATLADPFQDLDFEAVSITGPLGNTSNILPSWSLTYNTQPVQYLGYNTLDSNVGAVGVISREAFAGYHLESPWPSGDHFLYFGFDFYPSSGLYVLTQRGDVPENAIQFNVHTIAEWDLNYLLYPKFSGVYSVSFNGVKMDPLTRDISMFAGQEDVELSIEVEPRAFSPDGMPFSSFIDGFSFTVPEPSTWITVGIGMLGLVRQLRRRRSV
jgi:hypothetical protein